MEVLSPRCSGLDVHKRFLVACLSIVQTTGQRQKELRQFTTMTSEILALKEWLKASGCRQIAMESSGVYWKPVFHLLEGEARDRLGECGGRVLADRETTLSQKQAQSMSITEQTSCK